MAWIYRIVRMADGACYIGHTSKTPEGRWRQHHMLLCSGDHHARYLQRAWRKYGPGAFRFEVIEECGEAQKLEREQHWIDQLNSRFNVAKVAGSSLGVKWTKAQRDRLSRLRIGHETSDETRAKIGAK